MQEDMNIKNLVEFYIESGVDEICGDACCLKNATDLAPKENVRQVISSLAQTTSSAKQNARETCAQARTLEELRRMVEKFEGCALKFNAKSTVFGAGSPTAEVMIVGEAPGADEDRIGMPFVGRSGRLLDKMLSAIGLKREDVYITNVLPWRPPGNRTPTDSEVAVCLPFLRRQIELIKPKIILLLGASAANALLETAESISRMRGKWLSYQTADRTEISALASFHPAYLLRNPAQKAKSWNDFLRISKKLKEN